MSKMTSDPLLDVANEIFYSVTKIANFMLLETARRALTMRNIKWLPDETRILFQIKPNMFLF